MTYPLLTFRASWLPALALATLSACGGGGDTVSPAGGTATARLSGSISLAARTDVDSDINDTNAAFTDNSSVSRAQAIDNLVVLQGFATSTPTGRSGDTFEFVADVNDYFLVNLQAGQHIQLQVVDYLGTNSATNFAGDLDVALLDSNLNLIDVSEGTGEFEQVVATSDGSHFIRVYAYSGSSKYVLSLTSPSSLGLGTASTDFVTGQAIVTYDATTNTETAGKLGVADAAQTSLGRTDLVNFTHANKTSLSATDSEIAAINPDTLEKFDTLRAIKDLNQQAGVALAEPNYRRYALATPNDTYYSLQWHYAAISLPQAWDINTGSGSVVAVVDSGVVTTLPDLQSNMLPGYDFIEDLATAADGDGRDNDPTDPGSGVGPGSNTWHGTHVAGTVAAVTNNNLGVSGVAWNTQVIPVRVLGRGGGTAFDVIEGIKYAAGLANVSGQVPARAADVVNLSLGGGGFVQAEADVMRQITQDLGIIIIAASGNENTSLESYPAAYDGVVSVSAVDFVGNRAPYSNFGNTIDIAAPGGDTSADLNGDGYVDGVLSTVVNESTGAQAPGYSFLQGTSMAAPHVAGVAALMKSVAPNLTATDFDVLLISGQLTDDTGPAGRDNTFGYGTLNALKAVQAAANFANGNGLDTPIIAASPSELALGFDTTATLTLSNAGGGTPNLTSVETDDAWLQVSAQSAESSGLGTYQISTDRSQLSRGTYVSAVTFNFANASAVRVVVSAATNDVSTVGNLAPHYILLYDIDNDTNAAQASGTAVQGVLAYEFSDVPAGRYVVVGGTDIDRDGFICSDGEACGLYPTLADSEILDISGGDIQSLDFNTNISSNLTQLNASTAGDIAAIGSVDGIAITISTD